MKFEEMSKEDMMEIGESYGFYGVDAINFVKELLEDDEDDEW